MSLDFFDYTEFSDFNISNDSLLTYQDNLFYSFCIYEFHLDFLLYFFNIFNLSFFHKSTLKKAKLEDINKNKYHLSKTVYKEIINNDIENYDEMFSINYNEFILDRLTNSSQLDYFNNIMDIRNFMVKIPYLFFLLYT
jgi:hypothetical protein